MIWLLSLMYFLVCYIHRLRSRLVASCRRVRPASFLAVAMFEYQGHPSIASSPLLTPSPTSHTRALRQVASLVSWVELWRSPPLQEATSAATGADFSRHFLQSALQEVTSAVNTLSFFLHFLLSPWALRALLVMACRGSSRLSNLSCNMEIASWHVRSSSSNIWWCSRCAFSNLSNRSVWSLWFARTSWIMATRVGAGSAHNLPASDRSSSSPSGAFKVKRGVLQGESTRVAVGVGGSGLNDGTELPTGTVLVAGIAAAGVDFGVDFGADFGADFGSDLGCAALLTPATGSSTGGAGLTTWTLAAGFLLGWVGLVLAAAAGCRPLLFRSWLRLWWVGLGRCRLQLPGTEGQSLFMSELPSHRLDQRGHLCGSDEVPVHFAIVLRLHMALCLGLPDKLAATLAGEWGVLHRMPPNQVFLGSFLVPLRSTGQALEDGSSASLQLVSHFLDWEVWCHPVTKGQVLGNWPIVARF